MRGPVRRGAGADQVKTGPPVAGDALVLEGASREDAARSTGMDRQTLRDWVHRFNAAGPDGLVDRKAPGRQRRLDQEQQQELVRRLDSGPELARDGLVRWRRPISA